MVWWVDGGIKATVTDTFRCFFEFWPVIAVGLQPERNPPVFLATVGQRHTPEGLSTKADGDPEVTLLTMTQKSPIHLSSEGPRGTGFRYSEL
jgi:hypothetical protein